MTADVLLGMAGGLGLFLYGMKLMGDGLQKVAGARLRGILETLTRNRFIGMIVGLIFTAVIQSSSAATVLVVSFVNASLMNLSQAAGVIMGANIGTTMTGQLIAFNLTAIAPLFLITGVIMIMFIKNPSIKKIGEVVLGFGMLFVGMSTMSGSLAEIKDAPFIINTIGSLQNPAMAVLVGVVVTAILQSSSATVGILILLASQGILGLHICFYLILGCNIGACVSACLAGLSGKKMAKRAALIHLLFNIIGTIVFLILLIFLGGQVESWITALTRNMSDPSQRIARDVANTHTIFKVVQVFMLLPFSNWIVKLTYVLVPGDDEKVDEKHLKYIGEHTVYSPSTAIPQAICEIERMGTIAFLNLNCAMEALLKKDITSLAKIYETESTLDYMNTEITNYLIRANQLTLPVEDRKSIAGLFHVVNDIERIGDHAENIADFAKIMVEEELSFAPIAQEEMKQMYTLTYQLLEYAIDMFSHKNEEHLKEILELENQVDEKERELQKNHVKRLANNECGGHAGMIFSDLCSNLERVADHGTNIAFSILESDPEDLIKNPDHEAQMA